jgi:hypothetical protein
MQFPDVTKDLEHVPWHEFTTASAPSYLTFAEMLFEPSAGGSKYANLLD